MAHYDEQEEALLQEDLIKQPQHYKFFDNVEAIDVIAASLTKEQFKGYCLGNRLKYRLRAGNKGQALLDIGKSDEYLLLYDKHKHLCK